MLVAPRTTAVVIGRMQLPHLAHLQLIQAAFDVAGQVVIVIGSAWRSRNPKNPFTFEERRDMLLRTLTPGQRARVRFTGVRDVYCDARWVQLVRDKVSAFCAPAEKVVLVGYSKDASSYYLQRFPGWGYVDAGSLMPVDSTVLRDILFGQGLAAMQALDQLTPFVHPEVLGYLAAWAQSDVYAERCAEHKANAQYRKTYPGPVYYTGDAVVEAAGRFLLIERDGKLGNGTYAFPGGHAEVGESGVETALRELGEETTLPFTSAQLRACMVSHKVFDAPGRSPRGTIVTTACHFKLPGFTAATLPEVFGRDDAKKKPANWLTRDELAACMHNMFDDHDAIAEWAAGGLQPLVELQARPGAAPL